MAEQNDVVPRSIVEGAVYKAINKLGFSSLKPQQMMAISAFIDRRDVFVVLPTCFGKTLCFTCLPMVFDELLSRKSTKIITKIELRNKTNCIPMAQVLSVIVTRPLRLGLATPHYNYVAM